MKYKILLISLIIPFLSGCEKKEPFTMEFPIIKTLDAVDIDQSGATFQGELVKGGKTPITSYGFVWDTKDPNIDNSFKVVLGKDINSSTFKVRIDSTIANGLEYNVRTFAIYGDKTVYGNNIKFISKGSAQSAWSLEMTNVALNGWAESYGCANSESGFIIFQSSEAYSFDAEKNKISESTHFPLPGNTGTRFTSIAIGNIQYFFSDINRYLYKLQTGSWVQQSYVPFNYGNFGGYYHGFAVSDSIFILSTAQSYMYSLKTNLWQIKAKLPMGEAGWSVGGTDVNNKAYVITTDKNIWEYNPGSNTWINKTKYPGILQDKIISFSFNGKLYFGLSYHDHDEDTNWLDRKLWIYDPVLNIWSNGEEFPMELSSGDLFFFFVKSKLYIGHGLSGKYNIWKFDPSKI